MEGGTWEANVGISDAWESGEESASETSGSSDKTEISEEFSCCAHPVNKIHNVRKTGRKFRKRESGCFMKITIRIRSRLGEHFKINVIIL